MKRFNSLKKNQDFQTVYRGGKSYANKYLVMYVMDSGRENRNFRQQKGWKQCCETPVRETRPRELPVK